MKGNFQNKLIKAALVLAMAFGFISFSHVTTYAATATTDTTATVGRYTIKVPAGVEMPDTNSSTTVTEITGSETSLAAGWYVVKDNVTVSSANNVQINGDVNIILCDDKTLKITNTTPDGCALNASRNYQHSLTIWGQTSGTGAIEASGNEAIAATTLIFNGGEITSTATGGSGISAQYLTVNAGNIKATGSTNGIIVAEDVTINAGTIETTGAHGSGIYAKNITINAGTIKVIESNQGIRADENVAINGGNITATGTYGSGIKTSGKVIVNNSTVTASSTSSSYGIEAAGDVTIKNNSEVTATGKNSDGIEAGNNLTISDSKVTATSNYGCGILSGKDIVMSNSTVVAEVTGSSSAIKASGTITIDGNSVTATAPGSDAIYGTKGVSILAGTVVANGARTIGIDSYDYPTATIAISNLISLEVGDAAPGTAFTGTDYTTLNTYKYAKIQCKAKETATTGNNTTTESSAPSTPAMQSTSINGTKLDSWDAVSNAIKSVKAAELNKVADASDSMLQLNIVGTTDKIVPVAVVKALNQANFKFFHIFVGEGDAVTFDTTTDASNYTGISFAHKDTVTETSRTIDFTSKGAIGLNVLFHTTVPKNNATVNIYRMEDGNKALIATTVSNANGQLCFAIDQTAEYILEY